LKTIGLALALAAGMLVMVVLLRGGVDLAPHPEPGKVVVTETARRVETGSASAPVPTAPPATRPAAGEAIGRNEHADVGYRARPQLQGDLRRLLASQQRTPEESYAWRRSWRAAPRAPKRPRRIRLSPATRGADRKQQLASAISEKDPDRERRLAAFDAINVDPCTGLENTTFDRQGGAGADRHRRGRGRSQGTRIPGSGRDTRSCCVGRAHPRGPRTMRITDAHSTRCAT
jgi:hypothetical protein